MPNGTDGRENPKAGRFFAVLYHRSYAGPLFLLVGGRIMHLFDDAPILAKVQVKFRLSQQKMWKICLLRYFEFANHYHKQ
ncbi:hypothetical protein SMB34_09265 [Thalassospira permensis NBRC 106175]|uniref:Uncharacterized protein n=1 Tax=Thalassospira permensis NBRC 106175 TaxID=1353532 RepID=A0ABR4TJY9_9PROT|nr:hypothetical protein SMB34_09265 [Thalassospira permensis NBRC 106175]